ncbi:hypothetical protein F4553_002255 [Allocatelliglobosispora scoriae]|uniref:DUF4230 domain-containing protein n=1 Tax=Allocatelliglobosispora scoriae TaxID=643052 RepID=A0A841BNK6_9ACTN|nr:DUF4230 domain-containing protein [Allocatelliglobosispora scoriae]MBB5868876.1 hypothetical protein [Allocatelliglobosispora scoriae]
MRLLRLIAGIAALGLMVVGGVALYNDFFGVESVDRSGPVVLKSIQDLSRFEAASGNFEVVVDLEEKSGWLDLLSKRVMLIVVGSVDVYVDFSAIDKNSIVVSPDGKSASITLPSPELEKANLDNAKTHIYDIDRSAIQAVGDLFGRDQDLEHRAYLEGEKKLEQAARDAGLEERAKTNTRNMLTGLLRGLGFTDVTVTFTPPPP